MRILDKTVQVRGRALRVARIAEGYEFTDDPHAFVAELARAGQRIDLFTFVDRLSQRTPRFEYSTEPDNFAVITVSTYDRWFNEQLNRKTRNMVRKAEKSGVTVREVPFDDELVAGISVINNETPIRQGRPFWHYGDDLDTVRRENGSFADRSIFIGAFLEAQLIGYIKMTCDETRTQGGLMQIVSMIKHRDKAPTNLLVAQAVRSCAERQIPYLWYARFSYGKKKQDTLADFKQHNGFERIDVPRYYVPMTMAGRVALRLGLHQSLSDRLPEPLLNKYRDVRNRWYERTAHAKRRGEQQRAAGELGRA